MRGGEKLGWGGWKEQKKNEKTEGTRYIRLIKRESCEYENTREGK